MPSQQHLLGVYYSIAHYQQAKNLSLDIFCFSIYIMKADDRVYIFLKLLA
jgi:hypothetical protein